MGALMRLRAFAKVNYALAVRGVRSDGYHEVATVLQSISLADELELEEAGKGFELVVEPGQTDTGPSEKNTVYRAWTLLREVTGEELPVRVRLYKKIPSGAGLGGASADAAAALIGLNELFGLGLNVKELRSLGVRVGADVPFCISGGTALGEGIGEVLTPLRPPPGHALLVLKPGRGAETAEIYRAYDGQPATHAVSVEQVLAALREGSLDTLGRSLGNDLAPVTRDYFPEVAEYERGLLGAGALGASMSGTGTATYGLFPGEEEARRAARGLRAPFAGVYGPVACGVLA